MGTRQLLPIILLFIFGMGPRVYSQTPEEDARIYFAAHDRDSYVAFFPWVTHENSSEVVEQGIGFQQLYLVVEEEGYTRYLEQGIYPYHDSWDISPNCELIAYNMYNENLILRQLDRYDGPISMIGIRSLETGEYVDMIALGGVETPTSIYSFSPDGDQLIIVVRNIITLWEVAQLETRRAAPERLFSIEGWIDKIPWESENVFTMQERNVVPGQGYSFLYHRFDIASRQLSSSDEVSFNALSEDPDFLPDGVFHDIRTDSCSS